MDFLAAIPTAWLKHSKHLQLKADAHSCHQRRQRQYHRRLVVSLGWATAPVDTRAVAGP